MDIYTIEVVATPCRFSVTTSIMESPALYTIFQILSLSILSLCDYDSRINYCLSHLGMNEGKQKSKERQKKDPHFGKLAAVDVVVAGEKSAVGGAV